MTTIEDVASGLVACPATGGSRLEWTALLGVFDSPFRKRYIHSTRRPAKSVPCPEGRDGCYQEVTFNPISKEYRAVCSREPELCPRRTISKRDVTCWAIAFDRLAGDVAVALGAQADCQEVGHRVWRCGVCRTGGQTVTVFLGILESGGNWDVDAGKLRAHGDWLLVVVAPDSLEAEFPTIVEATGGAVLPLVKCCALSDGCVIAKDPGKSARDYLLAANAEVAGDTVWSTEVYAFDLNGNSVDAYGGRYLCGDGIAPKSVGVDYAGRVRLALENSALQFNVLGKVPLEVRRVLRVETEGADALVEFESGVVRSIDFVSYPDLEGSEKDAVRAAMHRGPAQAIAHFRRLPLAKVENDFRRIHLPDGTVLDLSKKWMCRRVLRAIWEHCKTVGNHEFLYSQVVLDHEGNPKDGMPRSDRLRDDVFKGAKAEFDVMIERSGIATAEEYRLKVRFE